jgi:intracellular septation protein
MLSTIVSTVVTYRLQKRIPYLALYVASITTVFGYLTLHRHAIKFIQMRDTLYDTTCALTLILGLIINVQFLKLAFEDVIPMTTRAWKNITYLWIGYFMVAAVSNEIIRRFFSIEAWFVFKGCVVVTTSMFGVLSLYMTYEPKKEHTQGDSI